MSVSITSSTGIHTYSFPLLSCITNPFSIVFTVSVVPTLNPAGIVAVFPSSSVYSIVVSYVVVLGVRIASSSVYVFPFSSIYAYSSNPSIVSS